MNALSLAFEYNGRNLRVVGTRKDPLFVAADVCRALGLDNPTAALERLDADEKGLTTVETLGGPQQMLAVSEPGLYRLILTSRKDEARYFQRWVVHEVLPAIRATGGYTDSAGVLAPAAVAPPKMPPIGDAGSFLAWAVERSGALLGVSAEAQAVRLLKAAELLTGRDLAPLMPQLQERTYSATEAGELLGVSANKVGRLANALGLKGDSSACLVTLNEISRSGYTKQIEAYRYTPAGVERMRAAIEAGGVR